MDESKDTSGRIVAAIILAAGGSRRMGQPKLLLHWHGVPLIRWVARLALSTGCDPVVVVTGSDAENVQHALEDLPLHFAHNTAWEKGQSTSVKTGIDALPGNVDAALVLLGDQPQIPLYVVQQLMRIYREEKPEEPILIPAVNGKRANPVLLTRAVFEPLTRLEGDAGARTIFSRYPVSLIPIEEPDLLLDVDDPEDYRRLMEKPAPQFPK